MKLDVLLSDTHKQKEQRNRKEKRKPHPLGAQADTHDRKTVLKELHVRADRTEKQKREETAASESRDTSPVGIPTVVPSAPREHTAAKIRS